MARALRNAPRAVLLLAVRLYQVVFRPVLGPNCRFHPSCSDYALEALARHGALRGGGLAFGRVLRCNPWHPGGLDPVPGSCSCSWHTPGRRFTPTRD